MSWAAGGARRWARGVVLVLSVVSCLGLWASGAWAGKSVVSVFGSGGSGDGQFANAYGTAVNTSSGDVYVVDQYDYRVEQFDATGAFVRAWGWGVADGTSAAQTCTSGCLPGIPGSGDGQFDTPQGIAIDQSDGSVYVVDGNNSRVEKFDASGTYVSQFGAAGNGDGQFTGPQGIAVDPSDGSVYVADTGDHRVEKFDNTGAYVSQFGSEGAGDGQFEGPTRVAVDSTGKVYVVDSGNIRIERFTSANVFDQVFDLTDVFFPQEIAIGPANDDLYVAQWAQDFSEQRVVEIDDTGTLVDTHAVGSTANNSSGLALSTGNQKVYLADGFNARVFILDDLTAATATIDLAANVTSTSADLSGTVTPNGSPNVGWHFETSTDDANWSPVAADQDAGNGNSPVPVAQALTGLVPNTTYFVRLAATRPFNVTAFSSEIQFTTVAIAPDVTTQPADDVTPDHAVLPGLINPNNSPTTYYFEYGTTTAYGTSVPATQDADAGSANAVQAVLQRIDGLAPGAVYHFRLVAHNQAGTTNGIDQTFTTGTPPAASTRRAGIPGTGFLLDQRGWEKVSPSQKNGADTMADSQRTRIAADGSAASFASLAGFSDAVGTSVATDYMSVRHSDGWVTHAIMPPQQPSTTKTILSGLQSLYVDSFSDDLSKGVFRGVSPVTNDPGVANVANIYVRDDLRTAGAGSYQLLSACPLCASTSTPLPALPGLLTGGGMPYVAGASTDYGHVIFESQHPLTSDAPAGCTNLRDLNQCPGNLYEWDHGTVRLVGILPDGTSAHGSQAGQGAGSFQTVSRLAPHAISADGSRVFFTVPDSPRSTNGALYMRVNHTTTVQLNTSERTGPPVGGSGSAAYWGASSDGTRVFFSTGDALTDDAVDDGLPKLYMYDASKPDSDLHNLTLISADHEPADGSTLRNVLGVSDDGRYVYFATSGQLVAGGPHLGLTIHIWHDGSLRYISRDGDVLEVTNTPAWNGRRGTARVTPDGQHLLFSTVASGAGPTGYDQGHCADTGLDAGCREFYLYSYASQRLVCVSCNPSGVPATASASISAQENVSVAQTASAQTHALSDDGRRVFFSTREALVPEDVNGRTDVYEYDAPSGTVHLISNGTERSDSFFMTASPSGDDVLFMTRAQLVGLDTDNNYDLYDARVGGGFTAPPPAAASCSGDVCHGPPSVTPEAVTPGSSLATRPGSHVVKPKSRRCRRGYVRKRVRGKVRCVKKPKLRKVKKARKATRTSTLRRAK